MKNLFILTVNLILFSNVMAIDGDSSKARLTKSHNIGSGLAIGSEFGLHLRYEHEKEWGKFIANGQMLVYTPISGNILFDIGLGYGHPVLASNKNALFLNGLLSSGFHETIKHGDISYCSSGILELELRRNISDFSISLIPFSRIMYTYGKYKPDYSYTLSFGLKLSFNYRF